MKAAGRGVRCCTSAGRLLPSAYVPQPHLCCRRLCSLAAAAAAAETERRCHNARRCGAASTLWCSMQRLSATPMCRVLRLAPHRAARCARGATRCAVRRRRTTAAARRRRRERRARAAQHREGRKCGTRQRPSCLRGAGAGAARRRGAARGPWRCCTCACSPRTPRTPLRRCTLTPRPRVRRASSAARARHGRAGSTACFARRCWTALMRRRASSCCRHMPQRQRGGVPGPAQWVASTVAAA